MYDDKKCNLGDRLPFDFSASDGLILRKECRYTGQRRTPWSSLLAKEERKDSQIVRHIQAKNTWMHLYII